MDTHDVTPGLKTNPSLHFGCDAHTRSLSVSALRSGFIQLLLLFSARVLTKVDKFENCFPPSEEVSRQQMVSVCCPPPSGCLGGGGFTPSTGLHLHVWTERRDVPPQTGRLSEQNLLI